MSKANITTIIRDEIRTIVAEEKQIKPSRLNENLRNYLASRRSTLFDVLDWIKRSSITTNMHKKKVSRSAKSGRFVSKKKAKRSPATTVTETIVFGKKKVLAKMKKTK